MPTISQDITRLRESGKSDDDILSGLEKFAPQHAQDIQKLRGANKLPGEILDGFQRYEQSVDPKRLAGHIARSRADGRSEADILTAIQGFAPQYAVHVKRGLAEGRPAKDIVDAASAYDSQYGAEKPWDAYADTGHSPLARPGRSEEPGPWTLFEPKDSRGGGVVGTIVDAADTLTRPSRFGASEAARGYAQTLTETGNEGLGSQALGSVSKAIAPEGYKPAHVTINPRTWGDIPKALGEAIPSIAPDIAAGSVGAAGGAAVGSVVPVLGTAAGGILGGLAGGVASYAARNYGNDLRSAAITNGGTATSEPTNSDKARALLASGVGGIASRLGFRGGIGNPVKASGGSLASELAMPVAKATAANVGTGVAAEASHQGLIDQKIDLEKLGGATVTGAVSGAGLRALAAARDVNAARNFGGLTPQEAAPIAQRLQAVHGADYRGTARQDFEAITKVASDLDARVSTLNADPIVRQRLRSLRQRDPEDGTAETLSRVQRDVAAGRKPSPNDMQTLSDGLGVVPHGAALVTALGEQSVLNTIRSLGNYDTSAKKFSGGMASSPGVQQFINPSHHLALIGNIGALGSTMSGLVSGGVAAALPAAQAGTYVALRAADALTGKRSPTSQFINRFGGPEDAGSASASPAVSIARQKAQAESALAEYEARRFTPSAPEAPSALSVARQEAGALDALAAHRARVPQLDAEAPTGPGVAMRSTPDDMVVSPRFSGESSPPPAIQRILADLAASEKVASFQRDPAPSVARADMPETVSPTATPAAPPATFDIVTKAGTRKQLVDDVRSKRLNVENGVQTRTQAREDIMSAGLETLGLSQPSMTMLGQSYGSVLAAVFRTSDKTRAKGVLENFLEKLPPADEAKLRHHLRSYVDPSTGFTFFDTWG